MDIELRKDEIIEKIDDYLGSHLAILYLLVHDENSKDDALLFKFVMLDTLREQVQEAQSSQLLTYDTLIESTMKIIDDEIKDWEKKKHLV